MVDNRWLYEIQPENRSPILTSSESGKNQIHSSEIQHVCMIGSIVRLELLCSRRALVGPRRVACGREVQSIGRDEGIGF